MQNAPLYQPIDPNAAALLEALEKMHLVKRIEATILEGPEENRFQRFRGVFTKEDSANFDAHVKEMRDEWDAI